MLQVVDGWDPILLAAMKAVDPKTLIDWKLLWRDPIRKWVSDGGRIALVGDAAHPHLATSGSGASQALEDGGTIGVVLEKFGKENVPLALRTFERLR